MSDVEFTQGDTAPAITGALKNDDNSPYDLTNVTEVRFQMRKPDDLRYTVDAIATIVGDLKAGNVKYDWAANDLAVPGDYIGQWQLTFTNGKVHTTKPPNTITVLRQ